MWSALALRQLQVPRPLRKIAPRLEKGLVAPRRLRRNMLHRGSDPTKLGRLDRHPEALEPARLTARDHHAALVEPRAKLLVHVGIL